MMRREPFAALRKNVASLEPEYDRMPARILKINRRQTND